jgi:hypothetical protein
MHGAEHGALSLSRLELDYCASCWVLGVVTGCDMAVAGLLCVHPGSSFIIVFAPAKRQRQKTQHQHQLTNLANIYAFLLNLCRGVLC